MTFSFVGESAKSPRRELGNVSCRVTYFCQEKERSDATFYSKREGLGGVEGGYEREQVERKALRGTGSVPHLSLISGAQSPISHT